MDSDYTQEQPELDEETLVRQRHIRAEKMAKLQEQLNLEHKIKTGAENMLQLYQSNPQIDPEAVNKIKQQLMSANAKIERLTKQYEEYKTKRESRSKLSRPKSVAQEALQLAEGTMRKSTSVHAIADSWRYRMSHYRSETLAEASGSTSVNIKPHMDSLALKGIIQSLKETLDRLKDDNIESPQIRLDYLNSLLRLLKNISLDELMRNQMEVRETLFTYLGDPHYEIRATVFRIYRYLLVNQEVQSFCWKQEHMEFFINRALARDVKCEAEREQAVKLVRSFIDSPKAVATIPESVVYTLIAVAENVEDKLRNICLETLCELAVRNYEIVDLCGGSKVIFQVLVDGPKSLIDVVVPTLVYLIDSPKTRKFIRPDVDIETVLSNFTDAFSRGPGMEDKLKICSAAIVSLLKSWTGLVYLSMNGGQSIRNFLDTMRLPFEETRKIVIETLFEIFRVELPKWFSDLVRARGAVSNVEETPLSAGSDMQPRQQIGSQVKSTLLDHHLGMIMYLFIDSGLLEGLVDVIETSEESVVTKATILLAEVLEISNRLLPTEFCGRVLSLPKLFSLASKFENEALRHQATSALANIERLHMSKVRFFQAKAPEQESRASHGWMNSKFDKTKLLLGAQIEDTSFRNLVIDSQVLATKDFFKWKWEIIEELLCGPLLNPRRLEEILKSTKLIKRLISFYRPQKRRFSNIKIAKGSDKYVRLGCALMRVLLGSTEGVRYLADARLINYIADCFQELDPMNGSSKSAEPLFSKERMEKTLSGEYFTILSVLYTCKEGMEIVEAIRIFTLFYRLSESKSREDLIKSMITSLDYSVEGHARIILSKVMTSGYKRVRLFATNFLRSVLRENVEQFSEWGIQLLITQLYDPSIEVCEKAVNVLDEACRYPKNLEALIALHPNLDQIQEISMPLLLHCLSSPEGFRYLCDLDYIDKEFDYWYNKGNILYVIQMELALSRLASGKKTSKIFENKIQTISDKQREKPPSEADGCIFMHFYGQLSKTMEGCAVLREKGHMTEFTAKFRELSVKCDILSRNGLLELKSILWALGNIGSSEFGWDALIEAGLIEEIIEFGNTCPVLSLKGTCFNIMGLLSRTQKGADYMRMNGWFWVQTGPELFDGFSMPAEPNRFFWVSPWKYVTATQPAAPLLSLFICRDETEREALKHICNISNHILSSASSKAITKLKQERCILFNDPVFFVKVMRLLNAYHYRLSAKRFIHDLFETLPLDNEILGRIESPSNSAVSGIPPTLPLVGVALGTPSGSPKIDGKLPKRSVQLPPPPPPAKVTAGAASSVQSSRPTPSTTTEDATPPNLVPKIIKEGFAV